MIKPAGFRVLVKPDPVEEVSDGGIVIITNERDKLMEQAAQTFGTLVAIGQDAWHDKPSQWANIGDRVAYSKYGGLLVKEPDTENEYVLLNDEDITAIFIDEDN